MKTTNYRVPDALAFVICFAFLLAIIPNTTVAQDSEYILEEILVTAEKRKSTVMDTPLAVSAFDQATLNRSGLNKAEELTLAVPNFKFGDLNLGYGGAQFTIRGISNDSITNGGDPSIAVYQGGLYLPRISSGNALLYDLERVEVLRGPQGTLYGRNTISGAINIIPNAPSHETEFQFALGVGSDNYFEGRAVANGSLSAGTLAGRLAIYYANRDGLRNSSPAPDGDDLDELAFRGSLLWTPTEAISLLLTGDYFEQTPHGTVMAAIPFKRPADPTGFQFPFATDAQNFPLNAPAETDNNDSGFKAELNWDFGNVNLNYLTGFRGNQRAGVVDRDGTDQLPTAADLCRFSGPFTAACISNAHITTGNFAVTDFDSDSFSSELRLASNNEGVFNWVVGAYYFKEEQDTEFDALLEGFSGAGFIASLLGAPPPMLSGQPAVRINRYKNQTQESIAGFGQAYFKFGDEEQFKLTAGVRFTRDEKDNGDGSYVGFTLAPLTAPQGVDSGPTSVMPGVAPVCIAGSVTIYGCQLRQQEDSWNKTTWKLGLDWRSPNNYLVWGSVGTGYRAGGFSSGNTYNPEEITAYEFGVKGRNVAGTVQTDFSLFYYDFQDQQVSQVVGATTVTRNAAQSAIQGVELVVNWLLGDRTQADITLAYLDAEYDVFADVDDPQSPGLQPVDLSGNKLPKSPEFSLNIGLNVYTWHLSNGGRATARINFHWEDNYFLLPFNNPQNRQSSYTRTDLRLLYESADGKWMVEAWVKNIEDNDVLGAQFTTPNNLLTPPQVVGLPRGRQELLLGSYLAPRTFGLTITGWFPRG